MVRRSARWREHESVGADRLEAVIFPQANDAPDERVDAETRQNRVYRRPAGERGLLYDDGGNKECVIQTSLFPLAPC